MGFFFLTVIQTSTYFKIVIYIYIILDYEVWGREYTVIKYMLIL
jgi:hypothetical protein